MIRRPPRSTRTDTLFPYTTLFRSVVRCVITRAGERFVTPLTLAALSENKVYTNLFDLKDEVEMGHIQLSREADLVVVAPATADLPAKMAGGIADELATPLLLATARAEERRVGKEWVST